MGYRVYQPTYQIPLTVQALHARYTRVSSATFLWYILEISPKKNGIRIVLETNYDDCKLKKHCSNASDNHGCSDHERGNNPEV